MDAGNDQKSLLAAGLTREKRLCYDASVIKPEALKEESAVVCGN